MEAGAGAEWLGVAAAEGWADAGLWLVRDSGPGAAFLILRLQV